MFLIINKLKKVLINVFQTKTRYLTPTDINGEIRKIELNDVALHENKNIKK